MVITKNIGFLLLAIYLILVGLVDFSVAIPTIILGILAIAAGVFILISK